MPEGTTIPDTLLPQFVAAWTTSQFVHETSAPWLIVQRAAEIIALASSRLGADYAVQGEFRVHESATIEAGVTLKGPGIVGPNCFVAAGSYLRGGVYLGADCIVGPSSELKTSFMFAGSKIAHLNFVGDSIIGSGANIEAGVIVANYRNELDDKTIRIDHDGRVIDTGVDKFGALIGDHVRIGANAVIAPGALIRPGSKVGRLQLVDQYPR